MTVPPVAAGSPYHELIKPIGRATKVGLVLEVLVFYVRVRWLLWRRNLPDAVAALRGSEVLSTDRRRQAMGLRLGHAVERTLRFVPFDSRCLARSLVLLGMLSRRGVSASVVIGAEVGETFSAHAWVESGGRPLLSPLDDERRVVEL